MIQGDALRLQIHHLNNGRLRRSPPRFVLNFLAVEYQRHLTLSGIYGIMLPILSGNLGFLPICHTLQGKMDSLTL
ncbi:hypothetical protein EVA_16064 [gut metagenome]|uniref:Uncharacterized protein n=1 Tax=gut metagenome TaxID=749906 RepID=J9G1Y5_9ZZZZ